MICASALKLPFWSQFDFSFYLAALYFNYHKQQLKTQNCQQQFFKITMLTSSNKTHNLISSLGFERRKTQFDKSKLERTIDKHNQNLLTLIELN